MKYYLSIGFPVGLCKKDDKENYYSVELNNQFQYLSFIEYHLWNKCFFDLKDSVFLEENMKNIKVNKIEMEFYLNKLIEKSLIMLIDSTKLDYIFNKIKDVTCLHNGFGLGIDPKHENIAIILNQKQNFELTLHEFNVWAESNNRQTVQEIMDKFIKSEFLPEKTAKHYMVNILLKLKTLDLIRFNIYK